MPLLLSRPNRHITVVRFLFIIFLSFLQASAGDTQSYVRDIEKASNTSLLWGPYRPNLYFGVRPRIPKSLLTGLLWARVEDFQSVQNNIRHTCEQHEGMAGYGWDMYDARTGGVETIHDAGNQLDLTISFVKIPGGLHGGSWGARIKGVPREDASPSLTSTLVFYAALEGLGSLEVANEADSLGFDGPVTLQGQSSELGDFKIDVLQSPENSHPRHNHASYKEKPLDRTFVVSQQLPEEILWQAKPVLFRQLQQNVQAYAEKYGADALPPPGQTFTIPNQPGGGNMHFIQQVFKGPFEVDILFSSGSSSEPVTSETLSDEIDAAVTLFSERYDEIFPSKAPFTEASYRMFSKSLFSNLLGGIGYFYGDSIADLSYASEYDEENEGFWEEAAEARARNQPQKVGPSELFTSIPSRTFFPRGFLWDEGFHLLPVLDWDADLTLDIVKSWLHLMDDDGWIAREQILGAEARSKVPPEFQVQYPHYANPPTLFFVIEAFIDKLNKLHPEGQPPSQQILSGDKYNLFLTNRAAALKLLEELYPLLKRHYLWFRKTQYGEIKAYDRTASSSKEAYRWRGRTPQHILTSGLDDYPRPQPPHPGELHVDLMSWMGLMAKSISRIAASLSYQDDATEFAAQASAIQRNVDDLHWSEKYQTYCDATIDDYEESVHVCHKGYVSIFPFLTGILPPDSPRLGPILDLIADPEELWSEHGLRSLSKKDEFHGTDENYWRGPVWINMNYLAIVRLLDVAESKSSYSARARTLYSSLRRNVVKTVYRSWEATGFAWEQYDPETGAGQRTQHFTGWTSLVVKIMAMPDLDGKDGGHKPKKDAGRSSVRDEL